MIAKNENITTKEKTEPIKKRNTSHTITQTVKEGMKIWQIRRQIRTSQNKSSFLKFLFSEYKRICEFGKDTHILYPKMFPPGIQLNSDMHIPFTRYLQPQAIDLYQVLTYILKRKWSSLQRKEYNLILIMKKLCEKVALTNFNLLNYTDRNLIDRLRSIETYFLALHVQKDYPDILMNAVKHILENDATYRKDLADLMGAMKRILSSDADTPSLYNFLLGLNMLKYRRYFELQDLISRDCGDVMGTNIFEYDEDVQKEIQVFIEESRKNLKFLYGKKQEIEKIKLFLPRTEADEIDYSMLQYFYELPQSEEYYHFSSDQDNVVHFTLHILRTFMNAFKNLLCGKIRVFGVGMRRVFPEGYFSLEFEKLNTMTEELEKLSYDYTNAISFEQYLHMKQTKKFTSKIESDVIMLISDVLHIYYTLGRKLAFLLHSGTSDGDDEIISEEAAASNAKQRLSEEIINGRIVTDGTRLDGKSVADALAFVVSLSFLVCHYYHDRYTYALLAKEAMINREIKLKMEMLSRIANPEVYAEIRKTFG